MRTIMMESITEVKSDIYKQGKRRIKHRGLDPSWVRYLIAHEDNGQYNCGCRINPKYFTICNLCNKHHKIMESMMI